MQNLLKTYRKKTEITIGDIAQLLNMKDSSTLSRCERDCRRPSLEMIFTYHFLFKVSIEKLFEKEVKILLLKIQKNLPHLIQELEKQNKTKKVESRILFLKSLEDLIDKRI